jgi:hypothetical protein
LSVDGTKARIVQPTISGLQPTLIHRLGVQNVANTHILNLFRRKQPKLYLLDRAQRRIRLREVKIRHFDGMLFVTIKVSVTGERLFRRCDSSATISSRSQMRNEEWQADGTEKKESIRKGRREGVVAMVLMAAQARGPMDTFSCPTVSTPAG